MKGQRLWVVVAAAIAVAGCSDPSVEPSGGALGLLPGVDPQATNIPSGEERSAIEFGRDHERPLPPGHWHHHRPDAAVPGDASEVPPPERGCNDDADCGAGRTCLAGRCVSDPCLRRSGVCAGGTTCRATCVRLRDPCEGIQCMGGQTCVEGRCIPGCYQLPCSGISCPTGDFCDPSSGRCMGIRSCGRGCPDGFACHFACDPPDRCAGVRCPDGQVCLGGRCVANPCAGVTCRDGEACDNGRCVATCGGGGCVDCRPPARCVHGRCIPCVPHCPVGVGCGIADGCGGVCTGGTAVACPAGTVCQTSCVRTTDPCDGVVCPSLHTCQDGRCIPGCFHVPCQGVRCPTGQYCDTASEMCRTLLPCSSPCPTGETCAVTCREPDACAGVRCEADERCERGRCVRDPCASVTCPAGEVCLEGRCRPTCDCRRCPSGTRCEYNECSTCRPRCAATSACGTPDGCGGYCNGPCASGQRCVDGACCAPRCPAGMACGGPDGCGGRCAGSCGAGETCREGRCVCAPRCPAGGACGAPDGCGGRCNGACEGGATCRGGLCVCTPRCNADAPCGGPDGCGGVCHGACPAGRTCTSGRCVCAPHCPLGVACGTPDGCGGTCAGSCPEGQSCTGGRCVGAPACPGGCPCGHTCSGGRCVPLCPPGHSTCGCSACCRPGTHCAAGVCVN